MALNKVTYTDYQTVITAANLNAIQDEIINKCVTVEAKNFTAAQKLLAQQNIDALAYKGRLTGSSVDLDNLINTTDVGTYYVLTDVVNSPITYCSLINLPSDSSGVSSQIVVSKSHMLMRSRSGSPASWGAWRELASLQETHTDVGREVVVSDISVGGYVTNDSKKIVFTIPLTRTIASGVSTVAWKADPTLVVRTLSGYGYYKTSASGSYINSSGASMPSSITTLVKKEQVGVLVNINSAAAWANSSGTAVANNTPVAVNITGTLVFS